MPANVVYFYKDGCPFSRMTHTVMKQQFGGNLRFKVRPICVDDNPQHFKDVLSKHCGKTISTFPQVFIDDKHIGGYSDFVRLLQ